MPRSRSTRSRATRPRAKAARSGPTAVRIHEAVGSSTRSWDAAVADAVRGATDDAPEPIAVEVGRLWADLDPKQRIRRYRASVRIAYRQRISAPPRETPAKTVAGKRTRRAPARAGRLRRQAAPKASAEDRSAQGRNKA